VSDELYSRILGCAVGNAIGDAFGGAVEFMPAEKVRRVAGKTWVDQLLPYASDHGAHPLGTWVPAPPRGTGTDDTRNNHIFLECVIRNNGVISSQFLAMEYIQRYRDRAAFYPRYPNLAAEHYRWFHDLACVHLGMQEAPPETPPWVTAAHGGSSPILIGLITLAFAGLLYCGDPEKAYAKAFELSFMDTGYARDATAMMAAMVSAALAGGLGGKDMVRIGLETHPLKLRSRIMVERVARFLQLADEASDDQALVDTLAREVQPLHPFDPIDVLGVPMAAIHYSDGDPVRSITMAANDRYLDEGGNLKGLRDVDCTAGVAGALVGALRGVEAFPADWVRDVVEANKEVYAIDLEANARRFYETVYGQA